MTSRLLPFLSLMLAIGIFFAYVNPLWNGKIAEQRAAIAQNDQALASAKRYVERENQLAAAKNAIDPAALDRLKAFLPDSVNNIGLILDLNALAARSGLSLSSIDVTKNTAAAPDESSLPNAATDPIGTVDLKVSAIGSYEALQSFLIGAELSERLLDVRDITVQNSANGVYTYQITLRLYWLR
ncbi:MAG: hypothetical protein Q8P36_00845 [bacterium]|nr:hypothetical protein [bacterium]